jgi:ParB/RepB/Spo0J family partition protein
MPHRVCRHSPVCGGVCTCLAKVLTTCYDRPMKPSGTSKRFDVIVLEGLKPDPDRPRKFFRSVEDQRLVASLANYGVLAPLIVSPSADGGYIIIDGYLRYVSAQRLGLTELPCVVTEPLNSAERQVLRFQLNDTFMPLTKREREADLHRRIRILASKALPS